MSPSLSIFGGQAPAERENPHEDRKLEDQFPVQMAVCKADKKIQYGTFVLLDQESGGNSYEPKGHSSLWQQCQKNGLRLKRFQSGPVHCHEDTCRYLSLGNP